jgi:hypothetical protein
VNPYNFSKECVLEIEYTTIVPVDDYVYSIRTDKPCQHFCAHFLHDDNALDTIAQGFTFMAYGDNKKRIEKRNQKIDKMIRMSNWILPGEGAIFTVKKKDIIQSEPKAGSEKPSDKDRT